MKRILIAVSLLLLAPVAGAGTTIYAINNTASGILRIDPTNSVATTIWTGAPFPLAGASRSATLAQCADGWLYFITGGANGTTYRFNPATPEVAPQALGTTGGGVPDLIRLTCHPTTGVLYAMGTSPSVLLQISTVTGAATVAQALTLPGATPPVNGSGDIGFDAFGTLYYAGERIAGNAGSVRLWTINTGTGVMSNVGAITGLPAVVNGVGFTAAGALRLSLTTQTRLYTAPITGGASAPIGAAGSMTASTDLSSVLVADADLAVTKTDGISFINPGSAVSYTITVTNTAVHAVTVTMTDNVPASVTGVAWTCAASFGSVCLVAAGVGNAISTSARLAVGGSATYTVTGTLSGAASGSLVNTATVALPWAFLTDAVPANNSATDTDLIGLNPTVSKSFAPTPITVGMSATLSITITNPNGFAFTGVDFTDVFPTAPAQMTVASPLTTSNTCGGSLSENDALDGDTVLEAGDGSLRLSAGGIAAGGSCTVTVVVTTPGAGSFANTLASGSITTTEGASNSAAANATLTVLAPLTVVKATQTFSDPYNGTTNPKAIPGAFVNYTVSVTNSNATALDANSVIIVDPLPANTALFVGDIGGAGSGPVAFLNGAPSSGLTYTFTSLASAADDVSFSNNGGATYTHVPTPDANGIDAAVTHLRINPKGSMSAAGIGNPNFAVVLRVRIN